MVGLGRFELPTFALSGQRSNQLSYRPIIIGRELIVKKGPPGQVESDQDLISEKVLLGRHLAGFVRPEVQAATCPLSHYQSLQKKPSLLQEV